MEGLEGLSIGRLADVVGMSKSGLFAHFGVERVYERLHCRIAVILDFDEAEDVGAYGRKRAGPWNLDSVYGLFPVLRERRDKPSTALSGRWASR